MNYFQSIAIGFLIFVSISGCSSKIDERQTEVIQGLLYKHGDTDPFTGIVTQSTWKMWGDTPQSACSIRYENGLVEGEVDCYDSAGHQVAERNIHQEKLSGVQRNWNALNGELIYKAHFDAGLKDGLEEHFDGTGKTLLQSIQWSKGNKDGRQRAWDTNGKLLTDLIWKDGKQTGVSWIVDGNDTAEFNYKDGLLDGLLRVSNSVGVLEEANFSMGSLNGTQTFYSFGEPEIVREWRDSKLLSETAHLHASKSVIYETDKLTCSPACPGLMGSPNRPYPQGFAPGNATNHQVQWPQRERTDVSSSSIYVDPTYEFTNQNGYRQLDILSIDQPNQHFLHLDQTQINKMETTFRGGNVDGVMHAWNAQGAAILEVTWQNGKAITATGSLVPPDPDAPGAQAPNQTSSGVSGALPSEGSACLDAWEAAYHKEQGDDAVIAADQIDEWMEERRQGKTAPKN